MPCHKISKLETRKEASKWHNYLNYEGRAQDDVDDDACSSSGERNKMQIDLVPAQLLGRDNPASLGRCCSAHLHNYWSPRRQRRRLTICLIAALRLPDRLFNCSSRVESGLYLRSEHQIYGPSRHACSKVSPALGSLFQFPLPLSQTFLR